MAKPVPARDLTSSKRENPRFPSGWFAIAYANELPRGGLLTRRLMDREIVVYRTGAGVLAAARAHCPHLGAHFGYGGKVVGEELRCPFHGFTFDTQGACTSTPYGKEVPDIQTRNFPVEEVNGIVFAYFDPLARKPGWSIPACDADGWSGLSPRCTVVRAHAHEVAEANADIGHFAHVHNYCDVSLRVPLAADGPHYVTGYTARRSPGTLGRFDPSGVVFENEIHAYGFGYSRVDIALPAFQLHYRLFVLPTPIGDGVLELRTATSLKLYPEPQGSGRHFQWLPRKLLSAAINFWVSRATDLELKADLVILENKQYLQKPGLAQGDGPIDTIRQWERQFYVSEDVDVVAGAG